jgi:hypothetical protein
MKTAALRNELLKLDKENGEDIEENLTSAVLFSEIEVRIFEEFKEVLVKLENNKFKEKNKKLNYEDIDFEILEEDDIDIFSYLNEKVLTDSFIKKNTSFNNLSEFYASFPFQLIKQDRKILDLFIKKNTDFEDWDLFLGTGYICSLFGGKK